MDFYREDCGGADKGNQIGDNQRPVDRVAQESLDYEECRAKPHQHEGREGDGVGLTGADGVDRLGKIAENHAERGCISYDIEHGRDSF